MHFVARARELLMSDDVTSRIVVTFRFGFFFFRMPFKSMLCSYVYNRKNEPKKKD